MSEINEELVRSVPIGLVTEIADTIRDVYKAGRDDAIPSDSPERYALGFISSFFSTFRNGDLDEALGVVGRCSRPDVLIDWVQHARDFHKADLFIALCQEKGGKDE